MVSPQRSCADARFGADTWVRLYRDSFPQGLFRGVDLRAHTSVRPYKVSFQGQVRGWSRCTWVNTPAYGPGLVLGHGGRLAEKGFDGFFHGAHPDAMAFGTT